MSVRPGIWTALETLSGPTAALAEWRMALGLDFANFQCFLRAADRPALDYPCTNRPECGCRHEVVALDSGRLVAACRCEPRECMGIELELVDVVVYEPDFRRLCQAVRMALGLETPPDAGAAVEGARRTWLVGLHGATRSSVYLSVGQTEADLLWEIDALMRGQADPFVVLAPTERSATRRVEALLARHRSALIALAPFLALESGGQFKAVRPMEPRWHRFSQILAASDGLAATVARIGRDLEAVARGNYALRNENEELRTLQQEGFFKFALRVEGEDFRAFAVIMALGNRKAAAGFLNVPHRSFYDRVERWRSRGPDYRRMWRFVEWRKQVGRKMKVRLEDSIQSGEPSDGAENPVTVGALVERISEADNRDYPAILRQVLEALAEQNPQNWAQVRAELTELLKEEVSQ
ncbi:MAG: hypothetical protein ACYDH9_14070 [Limisphaerales bacterium]